MRKKIRELWEQGKLIKRKDWPFGTGTTQAQREGMPRESEARKIVRQMLKSGMSINEAFDEQPVHLSETIASSYPQWISKTRMRRMHF
jgi:hypothetical protein